MVATGAARTAPMVRARDLIKRYGDSTVVDGVSLTVQPGECYGLLGPNGAGKTTTLRMLLGLTPPDGGELAVLGYPVPEQARAMRARVGVVPQFDSLDPDFTVLENLTTFASYFGVQGPELEVRCRDLIGFAELEGREHSPIGALSGGMKRRLALVRALVNNPDLVVLDEPTTGLDPQARQHIWQRLRSLLKRDVGLILTTHYMEEAERLCDRLAIIDHGRVVAEGSPRELVSTHIEGHVIELRADSAEAAASQADGAPARAEQVGETLLLYTDEPEPVLAWLSGKGLQRYLHRPAGLEDVFLRLTGRALRD